MIDHRTLAVLTVLICSFATHSHAALIIESSSTTVVSSASDLDPSGVIVSAINFTGTGGAAAPTINGIAFTNDTAGTGITVLLNNTSKETNYNTNRYSASSDAERVAAFDSIFDGRVEATGNVGGNEVRLTLNGLSTTELYRIQLMIGGADANRTHDFFHTGPGLANILVDQGTVGHGGNDLARIYTAEFTTDNGNALFAVKRTAATQDAVINGYVLSIVVPTPEPSAIALSMLGLCGLCVRRPRKKR